MKFQALLKKAEKLLKFISLFDGFVVRNGEWDVDVAGENAPAENNFIAMQSLNEDTQKISSSDYE